MATAGRHIRPERRKQAAPFLGLVFFFAILNAVGIGDPVKLVAPDGQSVLITQDGFDGGIVNIYTEHGDFPYRFDRFASDLSRWPGVKDQDCRLDSSGDGLQLTCATKVLALKPAKPTPIAPAGMGQHDVLTVLAQWHHDVCSAGRMRSVGVHEVEPAVGGSSDSKTSSYQVDSCGMQPVTASASTKATVPVLTPPP
ncbi:hypothetical protein QFZ33_003193 [Arthrobacter globiformis]|nr:hypothetical protein [Arthrobacter globiformis]